MGRVSDARERLVEAATALIWRQSYGLVSVDAICARAGVRKGSFYHFFRKKDDLVVAALEAYWHGRRPIFDAIFSASLPPLERLDRYFGHVYERQMELRQASGRVLGCFPACVGNDCLRDNPAIAVKVQEVLAVHRRYLESALRDAHAAGLLLAPSPAAKAQSLFAYVEGVLGQARIHDDPALVAELRVGAWQLLGLAAPVPPASPPVRLRRRRPRPSRAAAAT
jgi:TetR/AcrR family transcriptional repressor of nem operon